MWYHPYFLCTVDYSVSRTRALEKRPHPIEYHFGFVFVSNEVHVEAITISIVSVVPSDEGFGAGLSVTVMVVSFSSGTLISGELVSVISLLDGAEVSKVGISTMDRAIERLTAK